MTEKERINNQREQLKNFRTSVKRYARISGKVPKELIEQLDLKYQHYMTYYASKERTPEETAAMGILGTEMLNDFVQIFNPNGSDNLIAAATNYRKDLVKEADTAGTDKIQDLEEKLAFSECFDVFADAISSNYGKEIFDYEEANEPRIMAWNNEVRNLNDKYYEDKQNLDDKRTKLFGRVIRSNVGMLFEHPGDKEKNYDIIINENFSEAKEAWKRVNDFYQNKKGNLPKDYDIKAVNNDLKSIRSRLFEFFANELPEEVHGFNITQEEGIFAEQLKRTKKDLLRIVNEADSKGKILADELAQKTMAGENVDELKTKQIEAAMEANRLNGYLTFFKEKSNIIENLWMFSEDSHDLAYYWAEENEVKEPELPEKPKFEAADPANQYELLSVYDIDELDDDDELMMNEAVEDVFSEKESEYEAVKRKIDELQVLKEEEERIRLEEEQRKEEERLRLEEEQRRKEEEERLRLEEEQRKAEEERIRLEQENNKKADDKVNDMKLDDVVVNNIPEEKPEIKQNQPEIKEDPKQEEKKEEIPEVNKEPENKPAEMKEVPKNDELVFEEPHDNLPENDYNDLYHVIKDQTEVGKRNKIQREFEINEKKNLEFEGDKVKDRNVDFIFAREYCKELQRYANYLEKTVWFYQSNSESFHHLQAALKPFKDMKFEGAGAIPLLPDELAEKFNTVMAASAEYTSTHSNLDSFSSSQKERLKTCRRLDMLHDLFEKGIVLKNNSGYMKAQMAEKLAFNEAFNDLDSKDPNKKAVAKQVLTKYDALKIKCNQNSAAVDEFVTALGPEHSKFKDLEKLVKIKGGKFNDKMKAFMKAKENAKQTEKKTVEINPMIK